VRVSQLKPPPLDVPPLRRRCEDDGSVSLLSGDDVIATAVPGRHSGARPPAPTVEQAEIATRRDVDFTHHRLPICLVCGTASDDGLRIYAGQVGDRALIASHGRRSPAIRCLRGAVLDCPSVSAIESRSPSSSVSGHARGSRWSSSRGRPAATAASSTRLLRSTTRRDASSPSATPSGSSPETPPRSAAEPLRFATDCALAVFNMAVGTSIMVSIGRSSEAETRHVCSAASPALRCRSPTRAVRAGDRARENGRFRDQPQQAHLAQLHKPGSASRRHI
jgi:hypothetical protein